MFYWLRYLVCYVNVTITSTAVEFYHRSWKQVSTICVWATGASTAPLGHHSTFLSTKYGYLNIRRDRFWSWKDGSGACFNWLMAVGKFLAWKQESTNSNGVSDTLVKRVLIWRVQLNQCVFRNWIDTYSIIAVSQLVTSFCQTPII